MRIATIVAVALFAENASRAGEVYPVAHGSDLERELGYTLSVQDKNDDWRSDGGDETFLIEGLAPEYVVKLKGAVAGRLKDLFELDLAVNDANGKLLQLPVAIRTKWNKANEVWVRFLIKKELISEAVLSFRCDDPLHGESDYVIRLGDVPVLTLPAKSPPKKTLMEAVAIAEELLHREKIDSSQPVLLRAEFRNYLASERQSPRWHVEWVVGDDYVNVWVSQDGSAKLNRGRSSRPKILPQKSLTEAVSMAEDFLAAQKIDVSHHMLLKAEFEIPWINGRAADLWDIRWGLGDERVIVQVWPDGSVKLTRAR
jgi:hypothetical protein